MPRVLVVDDEQDQVDYLTMELQLSGWTTGYAMSGVDAVLKVLEGDWDVVLMDIKMPKLDGIGALKIIRRVAPDQPVVMVTGQAGQGDMYESTRLGAYTCLLKPVEPDHLNKVLIEAAARKDRT